MSPSTSPATAPRFDFRPLRSDLLLGLVVVLAGLAAFAAEAHGEAFADLRAASAGLSPAVRGAVFVATFAGFASKAGTVPLHVWLARAHPEAPSHVSALMSAAMVNLGVYGIVRVGLDLMGGGPAWWWLLVLAAGAVSALSGILQAAVSTDIKRLLAYSSIAHAGFILVALVQAALAGIYSAALYRFAVAGDAPAGFDGALLRNAFQRKA